MSTMVAGRRGAEPLRPRVQSRRLGPPEGSQGREDVWHGTMRVYNWGTCPSLGGRCDIRKMPPKEMSFQLRPEELTRSPGKAQDPGQR